MNRPYFSTGNLLYERSDDLVRGNVDYDLTHGMPGGPTYTQNGDGRIFISGINSSVAISSTGLNERNRITDITHIKELIDELIEADIQNKLEEHIQQNILNNNLYFIF